MNPDQDEMKEAAKILGVPSPRELGEMKENQQLGGKTMNMPIPIIRLEIERMKQTIYAALTEYELQFDAMLKEALDSYCTEENIQAIVNITTQDTLNRVIKEEVRTFYEHGKGREIIKEAIVKRLSDKKTYTPLDDD